MEKELKIIKEQRVLNKDFKIYGTIENPLFLAKDVAEWIEHSNPSKMLNTIDEDEKTTLTISYNGNMTTNQLFLTEQGLYEVLFQSRKPIAKEFKFEVKKILKQMRLTGGAIVKNREAEFISTYFPSFSEEVKLAMVQDLRNQNEIYRLQIEEQKPMVEFTKKVAATSDLIDVGKMAKLLHDEHIVIGRNRLFQWLRDKKILMSNNIPYQHYIDNKYFVVKESIKETLYGTKTYQTTYVTGKGQIYITEKLRKEFLKTA